MSDRHAYHTAIIGAFETGKSTFGTKIIQSKMTVENAKILVIVADDGDKIWRDIPEVKVPSLEFMSYTGIRKVITEGDSDFWSALADWDTGFRDGLLVFDDCKAFFGDSVPKELIKMFIRPRQRMLKILYMMHSFNDVIPKLFSYVDTYVLFSTNDNISGDRKKRINNVAVIEEMKEHVNMVYTKREKDTDKFYHKIIKVK